MEKSDKIMSKFVRGMLLQNFYKYLISYLNTAGVILAVLFSWQLNGSVMWAVIHGTTSWFYVAYATQNIWLFVACIGVVAFLINGISEKIDAVKIVYKALEKKDE